MILNLRFPLFDFSFRMMGLSFFSGRPIYEKSWSCAPHLARSKRSCWRRKNSTWWLAANTSSSTSNCATGLPFSTHRLQHLLGPAYFPPRLYTFVHWSISYLLFIWSPPRRFSVAKVMEYGSQLETPKRNQSKQTLLRKSNSINCDWDLAEPESRAQMYKYPHPGWI